MPVFFLASLNRIRPLRPAKARYSFSFRLNPPFWGFPSHVELMPHHIHNSKAMNKQIVLSTNNKGKLAEYREILGPMGYVIYCPNDFQLQIEVEETGKTYRENSLLKAKALSEYLNIPIIADDSGLCIDSLGGFPGLYSSRYAESLGGYENAYADLNKRLSGLSRDCHFHCCICYLEKGKSPLYFEGDCPGVLLSSPKGGHGFGYDPIFFSYELGKAFGEASEEEKNRVSHRRKAITKLAIALGI